MTGNVLRRIERQIANLTSSQQQVADYILKHPTEAAFMTLEKMAGTVRTSTTTVIRMTHSLGFNGFADFQKVLQELLRDRVAPTTRFEANSKDLEHSQLLYKCVEKQITNIKKTATYLTEDVLNNCVDLILKASRVYVTGVRTSFGAAHFVYHGLNNITGKCLLLEPGTSSMVETIRGISSEDLVIAVSLPRYARSTIEAVRAIRANSSASVISITDGYSAPLVPFSDIILPTAYSSLASHNSIVGAVFICDYLITAVALREPVKTRKILEEVESVFEHLNFHVE